MQPRAFTNTEPESTVSILTGPEGPMQRRQRPLCSYPGSFQSSPAPKGRCNHVARAQDAMQLLVSILTGPEGPMQPRSPRGNYRLHAVSILTGPEGPMQLNSPTRFCGPRCFNPHRPRRADATTSALCAATASSLFQSSPAPKGRCNAPPGPAAGPAVRFNPHRPRRADATTNRAILRVVPHVSILTGPEGPLQP